MATVLSGIVNLLLVVGVVAGLTYWIGGAGHEERWPPRRIFGLVIGLVAGAFTLWGVLAVDKLATTANGVIIAIVASALLFIGANRLFDLTLDRWSLFAALVGLLAAGSVFAVLWGNQVLENPVIFTVIAAAVGATAGFLLGTAEEPLNRLLIGIGAGAALGLLAFFGLRSPRFDDQGRALVEVVDGRTLLPVIPNLSYGQLILSTAVAIAVGLIIWQLRGRITTVPRTVARWGTLGFAIGAWLLPDVGFGSNTDALVATLGVGVGLGAVAGLTPLPARQRRLQIEESSRSYIFLVPALTFIGFTLVIPTVRTVFLSLRDSAGKEYVGFENYGSIFTDRNIIDLDGWADIFTSRMFIVGVILAALGVVAAFLAGRRIGDRTSFGPGNMTPLVLGVFLVAFAIFSVLRGTIINNLWWVFTVTAVATAAGLAIAVLADRAKYESMAKSMIFMPMAISFVGAGVIWRFMYLPRDVSQPQTGVLNSLWVGLGELSNSTGPRNVVIAVMLLLALGLIVLAVRAWQVDERSIAIGSAVTALPLVWLAWKLLDGLGGFQVRANGEIVPDTILFVQESPFNNVWIMLVLIWIQTGFTMVIFSAAIKAVPSELIEAARVDGATEAQSFWRVVLPQIAPTIGVVVTTLIVLVMKVFDMVKVMTNGNFDTNVIANEMWNRAFTQLNFGLGSALAVVLFVAVLPILFINIRRMQEEVALR